MNVTPAELEANNGKFVTIVDFTGQVYEGILHYMPDAQFPIQIWTNDCCFITFIALDDVETFTPGLGCYKVPCCNKCLPEAMVMTIKASSNCKCLANESYVLEWNNVKQKYEFNYPGVCDCSIFHAELLCSGIQWICYLALRNKVGLTCADGINLNFPIDCNTFKGTAPVNFTLTNTCACGPCANETITVSFKPIK